MVGRWFTAALAVAGLLSGCGPSAGGGKSYPPYRYRLTVVVDTPEGPRSGSSVIEVSPAVAGRYSLPSPGAALDRVRGEAVAVDLPGGQTLFALLRAEGNLDWPQQAMTEVVDSPTLAEIEERRSRLGLDPKQNIAPEMLLERIYASKGEHVLPRWRDLPGPKNAKFSGYPMLVRFLDIRDPKTVELVKPENLEKSFGPGYSLNKITIARTDDELVSRLAKRLRWKDVSPETMLDGSRTNYSRKLANNLTPGAFIKGETLWDPE